MIPLSFITTSRESKLTTFNTTITEAYPCLTYSLCSFQNLFKKQVSLTFAHHDRQTQNFSLIFAINFDNFGRNLLVKAILMLTVLS